MADTDIEVDAQDLAEAYDEDMTDGDSANSDALDLRPDLYDATTALGDGDLVGADDAMDADEEDDEYLDGLDSEGREADVGDEDGDDLVDTDDLTGEPLADDDLPLTTDDRDAPDPDPDDVDGVSANSADEPPIKAFADIDDIAGPPLSDLESDTLSDADLEDLDYKD